MPPRHGQGLLDLRPRLVGIADHVVPSDRESVALAQPDQGDDIHVDLPLARRVLVNHTLRSRFEGEHDLHETSVHQGFHHFAIGLSAPKQVDDIDTVDVNDIEGRILNLPEQPNRTPFVRDNLGVPFSRIPSS